MGAHMHTRGYMHACTSKQSTCAPPFWVCLPPEACAGTEAGGSALQRAAAGSDCEPLTLEGPPSALLSPQAAGMARAACSLSNLRPLPGLQRMVPPPLPHHDLGAQQDQLLLLLRAVSLQSCLRHRHCLPGRHSSRFAGRLPGWHSPRMTERCGCTPPCLSCMRLCPSCTRPCPSCMRQLRTDRPSFQRRSE